MDVKADPRKIEIKKEELRELYFDKRFSLKQCAKYFNCCITSIRNRMKEYGFKTRELSEAMKGRGFKNLPKEEIISLYNQNKSCREIAEIFGVGSNTIYSRLKDWDINTSLKGKPFKKSHRENISKSLMGHGFTPETIEKMGGIRPKITGKNNPAYGKTWEEYFGKEKAIEFRQRKIEQRARQIFPLKDTSIEVKIQNFLSELHLEFTIHKYISEITHAYQCDIFLGKQIMVYPDGSMIEIKQPTIIECDGCFFHQCPICQLEPYEWTTKRKQMDKIRTEELEEAGYKVIRLWEHEINEMKLEDFKLELIKSNTKIDGKK